MAAAGGAVPSPGQLHPAGVRPGRPAAPRRPATVRRPPPTAPRPAFRPHRPRRAERSLLAPPNVAIALHSTAAAPLYSHRHVTAGSVTSAAVVSPSVISVTTAVSEVSPVSRSVRETLSRQRVTDGRGRRRHDSRRL